MTVKQYRIGIDVGGTKIAAVLMLGDRVVESSILATPKDSLEHFLIMVQASIEPLRARIEAAKGKLLGIGIGAPGVIDNATGQVVIAANLPLLNKIKLTEAVRNQMTLGELPIKIDNDANCFVRAEALLGAGKKSTNIYGITIGTGIGGGWWNNGEIYRGSHGGASDPGHFVVDFDDLITLEHAYHKLTQNNPALLAEEAYRGDLLAEKSFSEIGSYLGIALSTIVAILDPEMIVMGGGALASSDLFLKAAKENLKTHTFAPAGRSVKVVKGKVGPLAGAIGAGLLIETGK